MTPSANPVPPLDPPAPAAGQRGGLGGSAGGVQDRGQALPRGDGPRLHGDGGPELLLGVGQAARPQIKLPEPVARAEAGYSSIDAGDVTAFGIAQQQEGTRTAALLDWTLRVTMRTDGDAGTVLDSGVEK